MTKTLEGATTREEAVFQAIGRASVCWIGDGPLGEFDSTAAKELGGELLEWLWGEAFAEHVAFDADVSITLDDARRLRDLLNVATARGAL